MADCGKYLCLLSPRLEGAMTVRMSLFQQAPELLPGFRAGDRQALERVYSCYVGRVRSSVRRQLFRGAHSSETEDLVHQSFLRAFETRARHAYDPRRPFGAYLLGLTRHVVADWLRACGRELPTSEQTLEGVADDSPVEAAAYSHPQLLEVAERFVRDLTGDVRAVHEKRYVTALSQRQAARCLGLSRQTLRTLEARLHNALAQELRRHDLLECLSEHVGGHRVRTPGPGRPR
jgi:RNA polymerase sigma factor (sigma-70 family)